MICAFVTMHLANIENARSKSRSIRAYTVFVRGINVRENEKDDALNKELEKVFSDRYGPIAAAKSVLLTEPVWRAKRQIRRDKKV